MMRWLGLFVVLMFATSTAAFAGQGVNLRWSNCFGDGGAINRNYACNSCASGSNIIVGSFELGADVLQASGNEVVIDLAAAAAALPPWWQFKNPGTCRPTALSASFAISPSAVNCADWSAAQASGGIGAYDIGARGANTARIKMAIAVPPSALVDLIATQEYFSFNIAISNAKTVGTGACAGCTTPVCIQFNSLKVTTPVAANDRVISGPTNATDSNYVTWQGGGVPVGGSTSGCGAATPARLATWSRVKALYR